MYVKIDTGCACGKVCGVRERRNRVSEIGARYHRSGGDGRVHLDIQRNAHEADADGADYRPRTTYAK
ncbi:hypothetical protein D3C71_1304800 [compost metagenome]